VTAENVSAVSVALGQRLVKLEHMIRAGEGIINELAIVYEDTVASLRQANAIREIFQDPTSLAGTRAMLKS
jgi:hypothetical protein